MADRVEVDWNERLGVDVLEVPAERLALHLLLEREPLDDAAVVGVGRARVHHRVEHACARSTAPHVSLSLSLSLRRSRGLAQRQAAAYRKSLTEAGKIVTPRPTRPPPRERERERRTEEKGERAIRH